MAFATVITLFTFLLLQPLSAKSDFLSPLLSPLFDDVCKEVECGKGKCKPSKNSTFLFECECDQGWKKAFDSNDDDGGLKFLPCIIPNCTLDYSCSKAPAPAPEKARQSNESIFDESCSYVLVACHWVDCGGGSCKKTSTFSYSCDCDATYNNLLNITTFPCFRELSVSDTDACPTPGHAYSEEYSCFIGGSLGMGCSALGISVSNSSSSSPPPPALNDDNKNEASSILQGSSLWLVLVIMVMAKIQLQ
ncbi:hypothetical protein L195_g009961 [Trifolium pratense]|uniref:Uncharacterized protein n=1 Tax=Trifolium pratense TaxID=57577 RepID=A0A2K3PDE1_TRIPR|nr:hypothetical protein L195_g009961 [Trifolium pratense]